MLYPEASEAVVAIAPVVAGAVGKAYVLVPKHVLILLQNSKLYHIFGTKKLLFGLKKLILG